ncbi:MAG: ABC transporter permease [Methanomassiliicoccales archaeon]
MSWLSLNLRAVYGRAYPRVIGVMREISWILFDIFLPLLGIAAFIFYYRAMGAPEVFTGFVIIGGAMTAFWMNVLWSMAAQFYWEKETGNMSLFLIAPMSRMAVLAGMALGGMFLTTIRALSTIVLGFIIFGVSVQAFPVLDLLLIFGLTMVALYGMGMMLSSVYLMYGRGAYNVSALAQEPIYLVSGFYFPVRQLGLLLAGLASIIPITLGLDGIRQVLFGDQGMGFLPVGTEMLILAGLGIVFLVGAKLSLDYMEYLGRREGRLTLRWQ